MTRVATEIGISPAQVAIAWVADKPAVTAPIVGARSVNAAEQDLFGEGSDAPLGHAYNFTAGVGLPGARIAHFA